MKKAFTLIELLIVVVVLVTLMTITFRLSSVGGQTTKRNMTIARLNRVENCLSGYYAAFGSYPPVGLHGYRNIYYQVDNHGIQDTDKSENKGIWGWYKETGSHGVGSTAEKRAWEQVRAACRSQPFECRFPYSEKYNDVLRAYSQMYQQRVSSNPSAYSDNVRKNFAVPFDNGWTDNPGRHTKNAEKSSWNDVQLFKFGVMSYILPRYLVMMSFGQNGAGSARTFADEVFGTKDDVNDGYRQWKDNNTLPHNPFLGSLFQGWGQVFEYANKAENDPEKYAQVTSIPSQAVTARWMPNLEGIVSCSHSFVLYGIEIRYSHDESGSLGNGDLDALEIYSPTKNSTSNQYMLDRATVLDGWGNDLYYYSAAPYQTYTLWSSGPNERTFPPWISREELAKEGQAARCVGVWVADDIVRMSN